MSNKRQTVVKKTTNTCCKNQNKIATQLLLNITKDRQVKKKIQKQIYQLKTNYCCCIFNLFFPTSAFDLFLSNSFSSSSSSSSSFNSSSFNSSSSSSSSSSFILILLFLLILFLLLIFLLLIFLLLLILFLLIYLLLFY